MADTIVPIKWAATSDPDSPVADMSFVFSFAGSVTIKLLGTVPGTQGNPIKPRFINVTGGSRDCTLTIDGVPYTLLGASASQSIGLPDNVLSVRFDSIGAFGPGSITCIFTMKSTFQSYLL